MVHSLLFPFRPLSRTRIKICGLTSESAALAACVAGADAIGLMFYPPSSRNLEIEQAARIRAVLPVFVDAIAVVVNLQAEEVRQIIERVGVSMIQFHGEETDEFCRAFGRPYIKALRVADGTDLRAAEAAYPGAAAILLDTHVRDVYGGSGMRFDWRLANYGGSKPIILAGGLTADNVGEAIAVAQPYGVDVSSGVETNGTKDIDKIKQFCQRVYSTSAGQTGPADGPNLPNY